MIVNNIIKMTAIWCGIAVMFSPVVSANENTMMEKYILKYSDVDQDLLVLSRKKHQIEFLLAMEKPCKKIVRGTAISSGGDLEIDEDDTGLSYGAEEFKYKEPGGVSVWIRIDADHFENAIVHDFDKKNKCLFSGDLMKRVHPVK